MPSTMASCEPSATCCASAGDRPARDLGLAGGVLGEDALGAVDLRLGLPQSEQQVTQLVVLDVGDERAEQRDPHRAAHLPDRLDRARGLAAQLERR